MTEGIIQQVFKKWKIEMFTYSNSLVDRRINLMQQELIEEIKSNIENSLYCNYAYSGNCMARKKILEILIGDNKN